MYKGIYSDWTVDEEDVREVLAYRAGLNVAALGESSSMKSVQFAVFAICYSQCFTSRHFLRLLNCLCSSAYGDSHCPHFSRLCAGCLAECSGCSWCCWSGRLTISCAYVCNSHQALHAGQNAPSDSESSPCLTDSFGQPYSGQRLRHCNMACRVCML